MSKLLCVSVSSVSDEDKCDYHKKILFVTEQQLKKVLRKSEIRELYIAEGNCNASLPKKNGGI